MGVQWLFMQHVSDMIWCSTAVAVVAQTSYFVGCSCSDPSLVQFLSPGHIFQTLGLLIRFRFLWKLVLFLELHERMTVGRQLYYGCPQFSYSLAC